MDAEEILKKYREVGGRIETKGKAPLSSKEDLALFYTPGVGKVSSHLASHPEDVRELSIKKNSVAVVSDGSAVLGLGNIGPYGALPVMEGKALIFKEFAGIDAWPIVLDTQDPEEIIQVVKAIAPSFGGINLEDIAAPQCFEIERRLQKELPIPVMHDDQHGTAIVALAGLINAAKVTGKDLTALKVVILGAGAAGAATARLLVAKGVKDVTLVDRKGVISKERSDLNDEKKLLLEITNPKNVTGTLQDALRGADVFIGVSGPALLNKEDVKLMKEAPIIFALSNPVPEIMPEEAHEAGAVVVATGRSDFPNQVNNALVFPGVFKGALESRVKDITEDMKLRAADALASLVQNPTKDKIIPGVFEKEVVTAVSKAVFI